MTSTRHMSVRLTGGPTVGSGYGWHLVYLDTAVPGRVPAFEEIQPDVKIAWLGAQKAQAVRMRPGGLIPIAIDQSRILVLRASTGIALHEPAAA
jgi:hypothetical protein